MANILTGIFLRLKHIVLIFSVVLVFAPIVTQAAPKRGVIYPVRELVTLSAAHGDAVYVQGARIAGIGTRAELIRAHPRAAIDNRYSDKIMVPGLIEHHVHPFLAAIMMASEVIAIEDWDLPDGVKAGARTRALYLQKLNAAAILHKTKTPDDLFVSWGFHHYFHGKLTRQDLDAISADTPILIIHRSFHEFIMNSAALKLFGITQADIDDAPLSARKHMSVKNGHFAEQGVLAIMPKTLPHVVPPRKLIGSLRKTRDYLHQNGVTLAANPGATLSKGVQAAKNFVFGAADSPFRSLFMPSGMFLAAKYPASEWLAQTEALMDWGRGRLSYVPNQVKLFTDGAIYSQAMQMRDGYLDGHEGAWLMEEDAFRQAFRIYWEAGYQIHVHQNGDAGLDRLLDVLAQNMARHPRIDHRTVIVHFGFSAPDQVARLQKLGALVSANPYYVTALSHLYAQKGVGFARVEEMVRLGDVVRAGVPVALHSDMPMAPGAPLFLMHQAVNRINFGGDVMGANQRLSAEQALRAVTLDAAYMMRLEDDYGSIARGKLANFTLLDANPLSVAPMEIKNIGIFATMVEGVNFPVQ